MLLFPAPVMPTMTFVPLENSSDVFSWLRQFSRIMRVITLFFLLAVYLRLLEEKKGGFFLAY